MQLQERVNVAVMMTSGRGSDVFGERDMFLKARRKLEEKKRKAAATSSPLQVPPPILTGVISTASRLHAGNYSSFLLPQNVAIKLMFCSDIG